MATGTGTLARRERAQSVVRVGVLGCGNVGAALVELIGRQAEGDRGPHRPAPRGRPGRRAQPGPGARRRPRRRRAHPRRHAVVDDPDVDVVVEVIGGIEPARELILDRAAPGKPVVTANKELLANVGAELFAAADDGRRRPAVRGGGGRRHPAHPRRCARACAASRSRRVMGIVNGTTNYILTKMTEEGADYGEALAEAQRLGYAERDPTADVEGFDAGAKAAIIATHRLRRQGRGRRRLPRGHQRHHRRRHRRRHAASATSSSCSAIAEQRRRQRRRSPCASTRRWCPSHHPLASVRDSYNAVFVEGDAVG